MSSLATDTTSIPSPARIGEPLSDVRWVRRRHGHPPCREGAPRLDERQRCARHRNADGAADALDLLVSPIPAEHESAAGARPHHDVGFTWIELAGTFEQPFMTPEIEQVVHPVGIDTHGGVDHDRLDRRRDHCDKSGPLSELTEAKVCVRRIGWLCRRSGTPEMGDPKGEGLLPPFATTEW